MANLLEMIVCKAEAGTQLVLQHLRYKDHQALITLSKWMLEPDPSQKSIKSVVETSINDQLVMQFELSGLMYIEFTVKF